MGLLGVKHAASALPELPDLPEGDARIAARYPDDAGIGPIARTRRPFRLSRTPPRLKAGLARAVKGPNQGRMAVDRRQR